MAKRKDREGPYKLTDFYPPATGHKIQDGTGPGTSTSSYAAKLANNPLPSAGELPSKGNPQPPSPFDSPVNQKIRIGEAGEARDDEGSEGDNMDE